MNVLSSATISLAEIGELAALQQRVDRKYVLTVAQYGEVLSAAFADYRVLEINGLRSFAYESTYFDTSEFASYHSNRTARRHRFKVRTRRYVESDFRVLEVKRQSNRDETVKERLLYEGPLSLDDYGRSFVTERLHGTPWPASIVAALAPVLTNSYTRTTLLDPTDLSRTTIDTNVTFGDSLAGSVALANSVIIETKSVGAVTAVDRLLWAKHIRPSRFSKFGVGMALLYPQLPANRWSRVLRSSHVSTVCRTS